MPVPINTIYRTSSLSPTARLALPHSSRVSRAPFRLGSALVQWDGSPSDNASLIGLGSQATIKNPWSVFQSGKGQAFPSSTFTVDPAYDWKSHFPEPVIVETPPAPQPVDPTPPNPEPDLGPQVLPPAVEDPFDPPPSIPDPQPPVPEPDGPEPPPSYVHPDLPAIYLHPHRPSGDIVQVFPYRGDFIVDPLPSEFIDTDWRVLDPRLVWTQHGPPGAIVTTFGEGYTVYISDTPTDTDLFPFGLPVSDNLARLQSRIGGVGATPS